MQPVGPGPGSGRAGGGGAGQRPGPSPTRAPPPQLASGADLVELALGEQLRETRGDGVAWACLSAPGARAPLRYQGTGLRLPGWTKPGAPCPLHSPYMGKNSGAGSCLLSALSVCSAAWLGSTEILLISVTGRDVQARAEHRLTARIDELTCCRNQGLASAVPSHLAALIGLAGSGDPFPQ